MGLLDFLKPKSRHPDPRVRLEALAALSDQQQLAAMACRDDSPRVRLAAVGRLQDDRWLATVAKDGSAIDARLAAVEKIGSQDVLADIIKTRKNYELMCACFARITDPVLLSAIAEDLSYNPAARRMAVEQFADESYLSDVTGTARSEPDGARKSDEAVDAILQTYGDIRVVRALGRFRGSEKALKALGTIAKKGGDIGGLAVEYLGRALGSSNPHLKQCAADELAALRDPDLVSTLARALDSPQLYEPIREVLRRIDTLEARAALEKADEET
jgi:hypothetical protein